MNGHPIAGRIPLSTQPDLGDRMASLFDAHHDRLYRLARRLAPTQDDALDLVQETFLRVARSPGSVPDGETHEEAWLVRILVNICRDQWRKKAVRRRYNGHERRSSPIEGTSDNPESEFIAKATIWEALDQLPPRRRAILVLHELDGVPIRDIAALLAIRPITVRWHLSAARRSLSELLKAYSRNSK